MQHSWRRGVVFAVASLLAMGLLSISSAATGTTAPKRVTTEVLKHLPPGPGPVVGACKLVPASVVASDLGMTMFVNGPANHGQQLSVKGKTLHLNWTDCNYDHVRGDLAATHFTLSFVFESSNADASSILKSACASMRAIGGNYSTPAIGDGACVGGHAGGMQTGQGSMAVKTIVISIFGNQSPSQTVKLMKSIAPLLTPARVKKVIGMGSAPVGPSVLIGTHRYSVVNGSIALTLTCIRATCSGVAKLENGAAVLAESSYVIPKARTGTFNLELTTSGQSAFTNAAVTPVEVTLEVTVAGGATVSTKIVVA